MRFYKVIYLVVYFLFFCTNVHTTNHYVDKNANGKNNGTSWRNAWESFSDIEWNQIQPGDSLFISGGKDSTIYYETLFPKASGTAANRITIIAGKYAPDPSGHSGRVILDGNNGALAYNILIEEYGSPQKDASYVTFKGFELRKALAGVYANSDAGSDCLTFDSLNIYDFYGHAGIKLLGVEEPLYGVDSTTIMNCRIVSPLLVAGQTDGIYLAGCGHTVIHHNYIRILNQDPKAHNDAIQGVNHNGILIYSNILINDSVYSPEGGGMPIILGAQASNPVLIYNNFIYMGGAWWPGANMGYGLMTRFYSTVGNQPPTWIVNNTIIINGPRVGGIGYEHNATAINNIIAMWCLPDGKQGENWRTGGTHGWDANFSVSGVNQMGVYPEMDSIRNNLYWKENNWEIGFAGTYKYNIGGIGGISGWSDWRSKGGTGVHADPLFVHKIGQEPDQGLIDGELKGGSPAINAGEDLQALIESFGLIWEDINGVPRDTAPTIGAYEYED